MVPYYMKKLQYICIEICVFMTLCTTITMACTVIVQILIFDELDVSSDDALGDQDTISWRRGKTGLD